MAKDSMTKENPVVDALRRLKEEEADILARLKPVQEAIGALEKIVDKSTKKPKASSVKESSVEMEAEETELELMKEA